MHIEEVKFTQLLNTDIEDIETVCRLNKSYMSVCQNAHYWEEKFKHDNLPLLIDNYPTTIQDWINEYIHIKSVTNMVNALLYIHREEEKIGAGDMMIIGITDDDIDILRVALPKE